MALWQPKDINERGREMRRNIRDLYLTTESLGGYADDICGFVNSIYENIGSLKTQLESGVLSNVDEESKNCIKDYLEEMEYDLGEIAGIVE